MITKLSFTAENLYLECLNMGGPDYSCEIYPKYDLLRLIEGLRTTLALR